MDLIPVRAGGKQDFENGTYACDKQECVVGIAFSNDGNQDIKLEFGGAVRTIAPGREITHFTNYPYINETEYRYSFITTPVVGSAQKLINIYVLKASIK